MAQAQVLADKTESKIIIGYCHFCACKVTAGNLGALVVAAKDPWCNKSGCIKDSHRWAEKYIVENCLNCAFVKKEG